jgi:hypothetical protein
MPDIDLECYPEYPPPFLGKVVKAKLVDVVEKEGKNFDYLRATFLTVAQPQGLLWAGFSFKPAAQWYARMFCEAMQRSGEKFPDYFDESVAKGYIGREVLLNIRWEVERWNVRKFIHVRGY